ncbi:MAG: hypothetical protein JXB48_13555 [Candidatus Latescibacteria bacterium]|nr:hypothetical protein [Candidatus Latescibacterota bacterium]
MKNKEMIQSMPVTLLMAVFFYVTLCCVEVFAAENPLNWNSSWTKYQTVFVQETAGHDRTIEPVEIEVKYFQPMASKDTTGIEDAVRRELRVVHYTNRKKWEEIPCQIYDVRTYHWNRRTEKPEVMVRVRVVFMATVPANMTETYYICYGNPNAPEPDYKSALNISGDGVSYTIENEFFQMKTDDKSGQIDTISLKFSGNPSFSFKSGNMHWNPDFMYVPEDFPTTWFKWFYAHNFENPPYTLESGPVFFSIRRSQLVPGQDIAFMDVYYRFYPGIPYFFMESTIEVKKRCHTLAIRNDEIAFGSEDFTHAGWRNKTPDMIESHVGEIGSVDIYNAARSGNHILGSALPPNIAWISMCHIDKGYGVGSIRLDWENKNVLTGEPSPLYNSHTVISEHNGGLYWFRSLVYPLRDDYDALGWDADDWRDACVDIPEGASYYEKNAYMFYEWTSEKKFEPVDNLWIQLKNPLVVTLRP